MDEEVQSGGNRGHEYDYRDLADPWVWLSLLFALLLSFPSLLRHDFLYHDVKRRGQDVEGFAV